MKTKQFFGIILLIITLINLLACCSPKKLCVLDRKDGITYLTGVRLYERPSTDTYVGDDYCLLYSTEHKPKGFIKFITFAKIKSSYMLHVIPENERFKLEVLLLSSTFYEGKKEIGHAEPSGKWEFVGSSDDDNCEDAKVLKYFLEHKNSKKINTHD